MAKEGRSSARALWPLTGTARLSSTALEARRGAAAAAAAASRPPRNAPPAARRCARRQLALRRRQHHDHAGARQRWPAHDHARVAQLAAQAGLEDAALLLEGQPVRPAPVRRYARARMRAASDALARRRSRKALARVSRSLDAPAPDMTDLCRAAHPRSRFLPRTHACVLVLAIPAIPSDRRHDRTRRSPSGPTGC